MHETKPLQSLALDARNSLTNIFYDVKSHASYVLIAFLFLLSYSSKGQTKNELLIGDWVEVRRETRLGYVFNCGGALNEPSIELSFRPDGYGTFLNHNLDEGKSETDYLFLGDTILVFGRINEIVRLDKDNLVLVMRTINKFRSENDLKSYFIRKARFDKLEKDEIDQLKAPTEKDIAYRDSCLMERRKQWNYELHGYYLFAEVMPSFPGGNDSLQGFIKRNICQTGSDCKGTAVLSVIIDTIGKPSNIEIVRSLCPEFDADAISLIKAMPNWKPGRNDGKAVNVKVSVPIHSKQD